MLPSPACSPRASLEIAPTLTDIWRGEKNQLNAISSALLLRANVNYAGLPQPALIIPERLEASSVQKLQELGQHLHIGRDTPDLEPRLNNPGWGRGTERQSHQQESD